jgi:hypothetical protein
MPLVIVGTDKRDVCDKCVKFRPKKDKDVPVHAMKALGGEEV